MPMIVGLPGAGRDRDVIEAELPRVLERQRAAEAHAAVEAEARAARERAVDDREEVLVPANGDAVLGDAAEAGEDALVELLVELAKVLDRLAADASASPVSSTGSGSIFSAVDADDAEALR